MEYPENWPTFFDDWLSMVNSDQTGMVTDVFMRVLLAIDQEIASREVERKKLENEKCTLIKDYMRETANPKIVETWHKILRNSHLNNVDLSLLVLENIKNYIAWIDIKLVANEPMLLLFVQLLSSVKLREQVMDCLSEIISKGMGKNEKLTLMKTLRLKQLVEMIPFTDDDEIIDFLIKTSKLVNLMGIESLEAIQDEKVTDKIFAQSVLDEAIELIFKFMNHKDDEVSQQTHMFVTQYLQYLKRSQKQAEISEKHVIQLQNFLQIIANRLEYDDDFNFDKRDEYEEDFLSFRKDLGNLFKSITLLHPTLTGKFISQLVNFIDQLPEASIPLPPTAYKIEVALHLFWRMGEALPENLIQQIKPFIVSSIHMFTRKNLAGHPHRVVSGMYFDIVHRYAKFLGGDIETLKPVLVSILDNRGIRHHHPAVRAKCCDVFMRLSRSLRSELTPLLPLIISTVKDLITFPESGLLLDIDDRLNLFEGLGVLVGYLIAQPSPKSLAELEVHMENLLKPLIDHIQIIVTQELWNKDTQEFPKYTTWLSELIEATATFSKGFPSCTDKPNIIIEKYYTKTLELVLTTLQKVQFPVTRLLRDKSILFMHRMMQCLGSPILTYLPLIISVFIVNCEIAEMMQFLILINQLLSTFKEKVSEILDALFLPLVNKIFSILSAASNQLVSPRSEEERELNDLKKQYYQFLNSIFLNNLVTIFLSPTNAPKFQDIFQTIVDGCKNFPDPNIQKISFNMLRKFMSNTPIYLPFKQIFVSNMNGIGIQSMVKISFEVPWDPRFNLDDAVTATVFVEICSLLIDIYTFSGNSFIEYLCQGVLPSLNCPPEFIYSFIEIFKVPKPSPRDLKNLIRAYLIQRRNTK
eukprot:TRINITY_DN1589_c0_g1_i1.p1 TRINITY_DN1589_c0_g1~~TRINITY_DN1589_c0_g1_i1.p1  ORF type:complete len:1014 (-),score=154.42 TRINITY_DN1589_c0_g1_i1:127-2721(-)